MDTCVENVQSLTVIMSIQLKLTLGRAKGNGTGKCFLSLSLTGGWEGVKHIRHKGTTT